MNKYFSLIENKTVKSFNIFLDNMDEFKIFYKINNKDINKIVKCIKEQHSNKLFNNKEGPIFNTPTKI